VSDLGGTIATWVERRMAEMLAAPGMWGSPEAIELQVLLLLELKTLALRPALASKNPRQVIDAYIEFLRGKFPSEPSSPLFELLKAPSQEAEFCKTLMEFENRLGRSLQKENPFEHSALAIKLTFKEGATPSISACTTYYEEFRRAARAVSRPGDRLVRRAKKDVEQATNFTLDDAEVSQPNGSPGSVLLKLGPHGGQQNFEAATRVREALSTMMTLAEWAGTDAATDALHIDDPSERVRIAVQAMRLVPGREVAVAAFGGSLLGRSKPVEFVPGNYPRFLSIVSAEANQEPFDKEDEVRAIDLDRGLVVLGGKPRVHCYMSQEQTGDVTEVGVTARVIGTRYVPQIGRPFVLVDSIETKGSVEDN